MKINFMDKPEVEVRSLAYNKPFLCCGSVYVKIDTNDETALYLSGDKDGKFIPTFNLVNSRLEWFAPDFLVMPAEVEIQVVK